jgi:hypothetical protein
MTKKIWNYVANSWTSWLYCFFFLFCFYFSPKVLQRWLFRLCSVSRLVKECDWLQRKFNCTPWLTYSLLLTIGHHQQGTHKVHIWSHLPHFQSFPVSVCSASFLPTSQPYLIPGCTNSCAPAKRASFGSPYNRNLLLPSSCL